MSATITPLPCPFCGGKAELIRDGGNEVWPQFWTCGCKRCRIQFKEFGSSSWNANKTADAAAEVAVIKMWNQRNLASQLDITESKDE